MHHEHGILLFLLLAFFPLLFSFLRDGWCATGRSDIVDGFGAADHALGAREGRVLAGVVDVPQIEDEAVFGLDFDFFAVEADASSVVADIDEVLIGPAFGGYVPIS